MIFWTYRIILFKLIDLMQWHERKKQNCWMSLNVILPTMGCIYVLCERILLSYHIPVLYCSFFVWFTLTVKTTINNYILFVIKFILLQNILASSLVISTMLFCILQVLWQVWCHILSLACFKIFLIGSITLLDINLFHTSQHLSRFCWWINVPSFVIVVLVSSPIHITSWHHPFFFVCEARLRFILPFIFCKTSFLDIIIFLNLCILIQCDFLSCKQPKVILSELCASLIPQITSLFVTFFIVNLSNLMN